MRKRSSAKRKRKVEPPDAISRAIERVIGEPLEKLGKLIDKPRKRKRGKR